MMSSSARAGVTAALFAGILLAVAIDGRAQPRFDSWTTENGLPQNSVNDILQTRDGYLWLATHGGIVRFDGVRFVVFDRSVPGIESQRIRALHEDRGGTLWAATEDGLLIRYRNGKFFTYTTAHGLPGTIGVRIEEDDAGVLWIQWVGVVTRFDGHGFVNMRAADFSGDVAPPPLEQYLDTWWRNAPAGLQVLVRGRVRTYPSVASGVTGVNVDRRGDLWIRTRGGGLIRASGDRLDRYSTDDGLRTNSPSGWFQGGADGDIWYWVAQADGAYRVRQGRHELVRIPGLFGLNGLRALYVDNQGSTWLGTVGAGVHRLRDASITMLRDREGTSLTAVYSMLQDRTGAVWIGHQGDLTRYADGRYVRISRAANAGGLVTCLFEDSSGRVWVGAPQSLRYVDDGRLEAFEDPSGFLRDGVSTMLEDRRGALWFGTNGGLVTLDAGRFTRYTTRDGLPHDRVSALIETGSGALWVGTARGVARLLGGTFTAFTEKDGFVGNQVRAFHETAEGVVWAGTYDGGLYRLADGRLTRYTRREGLHDNGVFQIFEDRHGYFWIGSNTGIYRVDPRELNDLAAGRRRVVTSLTFGTRDGLETVEVNGGNPAGFVARDGRLWFPTMGGVAVVDPDAVRDDVAPPRPLIEELRFAGEAKELGAEVRLPSGADAFEIRYTAPTFINPEQVRFHYRLQGLSDEWVYAGDRRTASFYGIPPGAYRFAVAASNHLGRSSDALTLRIVVPPPFWLTTWFRLVMLGALAAVLGTAHMGRVRRLQREQTRRSVYLQELIDSQERERARISNEMHDSLGHDLAIVRRRVREGLARPIADEATSRDYIDILTVTDRIDAEMKAIAYALRPYHLDKIGLSRSIEALVAEAAGASGLDLRADVADIDGLLPAEWEIHVYRIIQEAITNVVKHAGARRATVTVARAADRLEIHVEDDGNGMSADAGGTFDREGFGLIGVRERVQLVGGTIDITSTSRRGTMIAVRLIVPQVPV